MGKERAVTKNQIIHTLTPTSDGYFLGEHLNISREKTESLLDEHQEIIKMRGRWSTWLLIILVIIVLFDIFFVFSLGYKWIDFGNDGNLVKWVIGENLVKVIGLVYIVINFLFDRHGSIKRPSIEQADN